MQAEARNLNPLVPLDDAEMVLPVGTLDEVSSFTRGGLPLRVLDEADVFALKTATLAAQAAARGAENSTPESAARDVIKAYIAARKYLSSDGALSSPRASDESPSP